MILDRFQYRGLKYQIKSGDAKVIVDEHIVSCKTSLPMVNWTLNFKNVSTVTRAYLEKAFYKYEEDLILKSYINPRFLIFRDTRADKKYYLTYYHEYKYYEGAVNRPLEFTTVGTNDILEGNIIIPHSGPVVTSIDNSLELSRKIYYIETRNTITHSNYKLYDFSIVVKDFAKPISNLVTELVGESDVDYNTYC